MDKKLYWATIVIAILGLLVSIYMTIYKLTNNNAMCLGNGGCSYVNASKYSEVSGIPVAVIGMIGYLAILAVLFMERRSRFFLENGTMFEFGFSLIGVLYSAYLTYLEYAVIRYFCPFCVTSAIAISLIFILSTIRMINQLLRS